MDKIKKKISKKRTNVGGGFFFVLAGSLQLREIAPSQILSWFAVIMSSSNPPYMYVAAPRLSKTRNRGGRGRF
ncbi:hypothetical protein F4804DRAFT_299314 [Jackrogersella minutella]|nr:hypothetical protein F4804DRAFT_299314 [Jackrogersella minutella]